MLEPGTLISRYRVLSPLGAGGMGEVYLARDETLGRSIALKVLPPDLVRNEARVRRFIQEARSASSLSHPHIVTIHEIGQSASPDNGPVIHFIAMELVDGSTLRQLIHQEKTELRTLLRYLAQAADGLSKAHAAGIVHRDLKPDNIMVTRDGYAKVLDFGLAKLTERQEVSPDERTSAPTETERATGEGAVLGTVGYMSPEQAQGKPADHRSDIFSFGCILYEAATRKKPFTGDSDVEILHKILKDQPVPVEEINAQAPAEVRRLIRRCLAKDPNQRLDSMKALAIELGEIASEYDLLSATSSSPSGTILPATSRRSRKSVTVVIAVGIVVLAAAIFMKVRPMRSKTANSAQTAPAAVQITPITNRGDVADAVLSSDGRYLAYTSGPVGRESLRNHQINTGSDVEILPAAPGITLRSFSGDGDRLYYTKDDPEGDDQQTLMEIPSLGGAPRELAHVGRGTAVAPDAKRVCFIRRQGDKAKALVVLDLTSGRETILATETSPRSFDSRPAWSSDGRRIAIGGSAIEQTAKGASKVDLSVYVALIDANTGERTTLSSDTWGIQDVQWMPDSSGLILAAWDPGGIAVSAWYLSIAGGSARRITTDSNRYFRPTTSADCRTIAAVREVSVSNLWSADIATGHPPTQLTFAASADTAPLMATPTQDGAVYVTGSVPDRSLWRVGVDGATRKLVTPLGDIQNRMRSLPNGGFLFNRRDERDGTFHVIRADADGDRVRPLTTGTGEVLLETSPDGKIALYASLDHTTELWAMPIDGGSPWRIADALNINSGVNPTFSMDGRWIVATLLASTGESSRPSLGVFPAAGGAPIATLTPSPWSDFAWHPDGRSLTFVMDKGGVSNVVRQPLDGGPPEQLTHFTDGAISDFEWSPGGDRILFARTVGRVREVVTTDAHGDREKTIARFETGQLDKGVAWTLDGKSAVFLYGTTGRDAVLIRNFR